MYQLIVYKVINFKILHGNKMINKRYFQRVYASEPIESCKVSIKYRELKTKYVDWCYMINDVEVGEVDWYVESLNRKSEKAYRDYVLRGYK